MTRFKSILLIFLAIESCLFPGIGRAAASQSSPASGDTVEFAVLADLHFDPFRCSNKAYTNLVNDPMDFDKTIAAFDLGTAKSPANYDKQGWDSSYLLIKCALQSLANQRPKPAFVLCAGDFFAHQADIANALDNDMSEFNARRERYVEGSEALVAHMFRRVGLTNVYPVLGNNDSTDDYFEPQPAFLKAFAKAWDFSPACRDFDRDFTKLGFYKSELPGLSSCQLVVFNSTLFSRRQEHVRDDPNLNGWTNAHETIDRLSDVFRSSRGGIILAYHIPPGTDYYASTHPRQPPVSFWNQQFTDHFVSMLASNRSKIMGSFSAHTHNDEFRLIYSGKSPVGYIHLGPSISPIHGNHPAYQIFAAKKMGEIVDYKTIYLRDFQNPTNGWIEEYSFSAEFSTNGYNADVLDSLFTNGENLNRAKFTRFYEAGVPAFSFADSNLYWSSTAVEAANGR
jgi:hypothetical protein